MHTMGVSKRHTEGNFPMMSQLVLLLQGGEVNYQLSPRTAVFTVNRTIHTRVSFGSRQGPDAGQQTVTFETTRRI